MPVTIVRNVECEKCLGVKKVNVEKNVGDGVKVVGKKRVGRNRHKFIEYTGHIEEIGEFFVSCKLPNVEVMPLAPEVIFCSQGMSSLQASKRRECKCQ